MKVSGFGSRYSQSLDNFLNKEISPVSGGSKWTGALDHEDQSPSLKHTNPYELKRLNGDGNTRVRGFRINTEDCDNKPSILKSFRFKDKGIQIPVFGLSSMRDDKFETRGMTYEKPKI